jgi:CRP-like cAMP-binding protein
VRLLEADPDLARFLGDEERMELRALTLPVVRVGPDAVDIDRVLASKHAFGAVLLDGMLLQRLRLGEHEGMRLIGPGDVIAADEPRPSAPVTGSSRCAVADTRLLILGHDFMLAARRWPGLIAGLHVRTAEQAERVSAQVVVCQLPRVADRLLAMMWLLAESWGRVTTSGVTLPVALTHEALGALIGARRPTVSLALTELIERGAIVRQHTGWLLLESVPEAADAIPHSEPPILHDREASEWWAPPPPPPPVVAEELFESVRRLRAEIGRVRAETDTTLAEVRSSRERIRLRQAQLAAENVRRRRVPSSG